MQQQQQQQPQQPLKVFRIRRSDEEIKQAKKEMAKRNREYLASLSAEEKEQRKRDRENDKYWREQARKEKIAAKIQKEANKKELALLTYMYKTDVFFYHHGDKDSLKSEIEDQIINLKETGNHKEYDPYIWNYQGEGNNYMFRSELHMIWSHREFETIHDVPLDGTYIFYAYDLGQRGLGSFNKISVHKVGEEPYVAYVNPGSFPPITSF